MNDRADKSKLDTLTLSWAIHSLSGISSPANAAYSLSELVHQLKSSGSRALFTCLPLLSVALKAAAECGIPKNRVYLLSLPQEVTEGSERLNEFKTVDQMIKDGEKLPPIEKLKWTKGQGARQTAFLCYSSGTSGLPVCSFPAPLESRLPCLFHAERCHDIPQECHREYFANYDL